MLEKFATDIWIADGTEVSVAGFVYPTRCAVIRLAQNELLVWSPVSLTPALQVQIDALGVVTHLIAPNSLHHLFLAQWQDAYPDAKLFGTLALRHKRPDLHFAGTLGDAPDPAWATQLDQIVVAHKLTTEVVFFHKPSQTVIFTDLIQQFPRNWHKGWRKIVATLDLMVGEMPNVPRKFRMGFGRKRQARATISQILDWPIDRIILAHGQPVHQDGRAVLGRAFHWLLKP